MRIYVVDAFTDAAFGGNPAGVCLVDEERDDAWMQSVAAEMRHSETAFLRRGPDGFGLRWFTPTTEVELCGHATLASAHVLWTEGVAPVAPLRFHTASGVLTARAGEGGWIELDFPAEPAAEADPAPELLAALGIDTATWVGRNRFDYVVEVPDAATVSALAPDMTALARVPARGVVVTAPAADGAHDFVSRFFGPAAGIPEDPVTGSAHCCLGPLWGARLGKAELVGRQLSPRGGVVRVRPAGDRVVLGGQAVTVVRGELAV